VNRYAIRAEQGTVSYFSNGAFRKLAENASGTWRLAVRPDTAVQIYHGSALIATYPSELTSSLSHAARGPFVESSPAGVLVDGSGAFAP